MTATGVFAFLVCADQVSYRLCWLSNHLQMDWLITFAITVTINTASKSNFMPPLCYQYGSGNAIKYNTKRRKILFQIRHCLDTCWYQPEKKKTCLPISSYNCYYYTNFISGIDWPDSCSVPFARSNNDRGVNRLVNAFCYAVCITIRTHTGFPENKFFCIFL